MDRNVEPDEAASTDEADSNVVEFQKPKKQKPQLVLTSELKRDMLALLIAEQERRRLLQFSPFTSFRDDPEGFIESALLGYLWSKQREIVRSVYANRRTAVPSAHDTGKSAIAARIAAWWLSVHAPGEAFVVTLAPTLQQVRAILWREINRVHKAGGLPGRTNQTEWWIDPEMVGFGRSPKDTDPTALQGIHQRRVLVIMDEACGIGRELADAADSLIANEESRMLAIGNPDDPDTWFGDVCKPGSGFNVIPVSAFDSPNFTGEEVPDWLKPLLVSRIWQQEKARSWGEDSPIYKAKVLGLFSPQSTDALVPLAALNAAKTRELLEGVPIELGIDVSRFGGDATVIYARRGLVARRVAKDRNRDLMHVVGMVVRAVGQTGASVVKIDDIGLGGGVTDRLKEIKNDPREPGHLVMRNVTVIGVNVGESPSTDKADERFKNLRAELNWGMRMRFVEGNIALAGDQTDHDDMLAQASQIKYKLTSSGEIQIEAKADMKKRTKGVSPDDWDAIVLCFGTPGTNMIALYEKLAS